MNKLIETIDGSYFVPNHLTTYEKLEDGTYKVIMITESGAGFYKRITEGTMNYIRAQAQDWSEDE